MSVTQILFNKRNIFTGLSTDDKPVHGVKNGDLFQEIDTSKTFMFSEDDKTWYEQSAGGGTSDNPFELITVHFSWDDEFTATVDKTYGEIYQAISNGKIPMAFSPEIGAVGSVLLDSDDAPCNIDFGVAVANSFYGQALNTYSVEMLPDGDVYAYVYENLYVGEVKYFETVLSGGSVTGGASYAEILDPITKNLNPHINMYIDDNSREFFNVLMYNADEIVFTNHLHYIKVLSSDDWEFGYIEDLVIE